MLGLSLSVLVFSLCLCGVSPTPVSVAGVNSTCLVLADSLPLECGGLMHLAASWRRLVAFAQTWIQYFGCIANVLGEGVRAAFVVPSVSLQFAGGLPGAPHRSSLLTPLGQYLA